MPKKSKYEWQKIGQRLMEETRAKNIQTHLEAEQQRVKERQKQLAVMIEERQQRLPTKCERCGGMMSPDGDNGASCIMCGEYVYGEIKENFIHHKPWPPKGKTW